MRLCFLHPPPNENSLSVSGNHVQGGFALRIIKVR